MHFRPEADARIFLCIDEDACDPMTSTVTDSGGFFVLIPGDLNATKQYSILIRPIGDAEQRKPIGSSGDIALLKEPISIEYRGSANSQIDEHALTLNKHPVNAKMSVFFGTDRSFSQSGLTVGILNENSHDGTLTYGTCDVVIETNQAYDRSIHYISDIGRNGLYYSVQALALFPRAQFWNNFTHTLSSNGSHDALLFIHGYNTSFNEACRRAAQIAYDLKFEGPVLLYSWPSHDSWLSYTADEEMTEWTGKHFRQFLKEVLDRPDLHKLHIIAHSMGNRVLTRALFSESLTSPEQERIGQVILAAPDLNRLIFDESDLSKIPAVRITLYASDHDQALRTSKIFHQFSRVGYSHPDMYLRSGIDSIDASDVDTSLLGHSYFAESRSVLADIDSLISLNKDPAKRFGLVLKGQAPRQWWYLQP